MNNLQFSLSIGLPVLFILAGMFFNWSAANSLRTEIGNLRTEVRGEISGLRTEVRGEIGSLRDKLEDVKDSNHKDALEIMRQMTALHERVAIVESKQK
jgi:hypothetical protein